MLFRSTEQLVSLKGLARDLFAEYLLPTATELPQIELVTSRAAPVSPAYLMKTYGRGVWPGDARRRRPVKPNVSSN